jgi:hypothetical protein
MKTTTHQVEPVPGINGVWKYRGVPFKEGGMYPWSTYAVIKVGAPHPGLTRLTAASQKALLKKIDRHLDGGGEVQG